MLTALTDQKSIDAMSLTPAHAWGGAKSSTPLVPFVGVREGRRGGVGISQARLHDVLCVYVEGGVEECVGFGIHMYIDTCFVW